MSSIADRMKKYENVSSYKLITRMPVIVRVDGKTFHSYTKGFDRPFDEKLNIAMVESAKKVMKEMMGCVLAYHQSDEISFLLVDYQTFETEPWFDNKIQKIASVTASMFSTFFNQGMKDKPTAVFDARCFNLSKEEVPNYFVWRCKDWYRNSVKMLAQSLYSQKQLHKKNCDEMHEMIHEKGQNWARLEGKWKNGTFLTRSERSIIENVDILPNYDKVSGLIDPLILI